MCSLVLFLFSPKIRKRKSSKCHFNFQIQQTVYSFTLAHNNMRKTKRTPDLSYLLKSFKCDGRVTYSPPLRNIVLVDRSRGKSPVADFLAATPSLRQPLLYLFITHPRDACTRVVGWVGVRVFMHAHTRTRIQTTHGHTHKHTFTLTLTLLSRTHACTHARTHTGNPTLRSHTRTSKYTRAHAHSHTHILNQLIMMALN